MLVLIIFGIRRTVMCSPPSILICLQLLISAKGFRDSPDRVIAKTIFLFFFLSKTTFLMYILFFLMAKDRVIAKILICSQFSYIYWNIKTSRKSEVTSKEKNILSLFHNLIYDTQTRFSIFECHYDFVKHKNF